MTNKVNLSLEKTVCSYQTVQFSTRHTQEQVNDWLKSTVQEPDYWECQYGSEEWNSGDEYTDSIHVERREFDEGQGDDHCPYDDEIQEWLDYSK